MNTLLSHFLEVTLAFAVFAGIHSLLARPGVKAAIRAAMGAAATSYRLLYNLLSLLLFGALFLIVPPSGRELYAVPAPAAYGLRAIQLAALFVFLRALRDFDMRAFLGLAGRHGTGEAGETLNLGGLFRYCRHPMYAAISVMLISNPVMTAGLFAYTLNTILYFIIGSELEERQLEKRFGEVYLHYRRAVPRFVPRPSRRRK